MGNIVAGPVCRLRGVLQGDSDLDTRLSRRLQQFQAEVSDCGWGVRRQRPGRLGRHGVGCQAVREGRPCRR